MHTKISAVDELSAYLADHTRPFAESAASIFASKGWTWYDRDHVTAGAIAGIVSSLYWASVEMMAEKSNTVDWHMCASTGRVRLTTLHYAKTGTLQFSLSLDVEG